MSDLPRTLPGREDDAALGVDALDVIRKQIANHVDATQGAWLRAPAWKRAWPLVAGALVATAWSMYAAMNGALGAAAALAWLAAIGAFVAVARAPSHPSSSEMMARVALAAGCLALAVEIGLAWFASASLPGDDLRCARGVVLGGVLPCALLVVYLRASRAPARLFHVAAIGAAAFLASSAAVWSSCPATDHAHVLFSHVAAPIVVAAVAVFALRPLLRGAPLSPPR